MSNKKILKFPKKEMTIEEVCAAIGWNVTIVDRPDENYVIEHDAPEHELVYWAGHKKPME